MFFWMWDSIQELSSLCTPTTLLHPFGWMQAPSLNKGTKFHLWAITYLGNAQALICPSFHCTSIPPHPPAPSHSNRPYWEGNQSPWQNKCDFESYFYLFFLISNHSIHHKIIICDILHSYFSSSIFFFGGCRLEIRPTLH